MKLGSHVYKEIARDALRGNWVKAAAVGILASWFGVFSSSVLFVAECMIAVAAAIYFLEAIPGSFLLLFGCAAVFALFYFFIGGAIKLGYLDFNLAILDRRRSRIALLFGKGSSWWKAVCAKVVSFVIILVGYVFLIIPGVILTYMYAMVPYVLEERPDFTVQEAFMASRQIMKGHKWELFCLHFSFVGWYILGIITLGIGLIFVTPYRCTAEAAFYNEISGRADLFYGRKQGSRQEEL